MRCECVGKILRGHVVPYNMFMGLDDNDKVLRENLQCFVGELPISVELYDGSLYLQAGSEDFEILDKVDFNYCPFCGTALSRRV